MPERRQNGLPCEVAERKQIKKYVWVKWNFVDALCGVISALERGKTDVASDNDGVKVIGTGRTHIIRGAWEGDWQVTQVEPPNYTCPGLQTHSPSTIRSKGHT